MKTNCRSLSLLLWVLLFATLSIPSEGLSRVTPIYKDGKLTYVVQIQIYGSYATPELAEKWESESNRIFNQAAAASGNCIPTEFEIQIDYAGDTAFSVDDGNESWYVQPVRPGQFFRSHVKIGENGSYSADGSGSIASNAANMTVVHEISHVLGHPDMYVDNEEGNSEPNPGWGDNLMGKSEKSNLFALWVGEESYFDPRNFDIFNDSVSKELGIEFPKCLSFSGVIDLISNEPSQCNRDKIEGQFSVSFQVENDQFSGRGSGSVQWTPVSRCEGTDYGGQRTANGYPVKASGWTDEDGNLHLGIYPQDETEAFFTNGEVYARGSVLPILFEYSTGFGAPGSLTDFVLPPDRQVGDKYEFRVSDPHHDGAWFDGAVTIEVAGTD